MVTIYELLEVDEDATKEEIEKAYHSLILEFHQDPNFDEKTNKENEMILNKMKIAYEILMNDEKRKKYDQDLAQKRAENLIQNVSTSDEKEKNEIIEEHHINEVNREEPINQNRIGNKSETIQEENIQNQIKENSENQIEENENLLTDDEKSKLRKAAKKEFKQNLKKAKQAEEEYNEAYNEAYRNYLRKMGYQVKEPWTLKRIKKLVITILAIVIIMFIAWMIPPVRNMLIGLYEENFIINALVNLVKMFFEAIFSIFK